MLRLKRYKTKKAQSVLEYTIIMGIMGVVLFAMSPMIKRGSQGMIKLVADQIGNQEEADQFADRDSQEELTGSSRDGYMDSTNSIIRSFVEKRRVEDVGLLNYEYNDRTETESEVLLDLGFTETN